MNGFDKIVASHLLKERRDELVETHDERQKELNRLYEELKQENIEL
jgi:malate synthase